MNTSCCSGRIIDGGLCGFLQVPSYPDGVEASNGKIYVIYDRGRETDREILMATFTEEDIKQGKCVSDQCQLKMIVNKAGE